MYTLKNIKSSIQILFPHLIYGRFKQIFSELLLFTQGTILYSTVLLQTSVLSIIFLIYTFRRMLGFVLLGLEIFMNIADQRFCYAITLFPHPCRHCISPYKYKIINLFKLECMHAFQTTSYLSLYIISSGMFLVT